MVEKEGTEGEEQAKRAYQAARKDIDDAAEMAIDDKVSSALINRVITYARILSFISSMFFTLISCN